LREKTPPALDVKLAVTCYASVRASEMIEEGRKDA